MSDILDSYSIAAPSPQQAVDIFKGERSTILPADIGADTGGRAAVFDDARITWFLSRLGSIEGQSVLELGPLEAEHTYMLEYAGAGAGAGSVRFGSVRFGSVRLWRWRATAALTLT